jgi:hypothetical protein
MSGRGRTARNPGTGHHVPVTTPTPTAPSLPPDPVQYDAVRNEHARKRGLQQPYIAGGDDPDLPRTLVRERPYVQILVAMTAGIVALGFVLGIVAAIITGPS